MDPRVILSFTPGEIVAPGTALRVGCCRPIKPASVEAALTCRDQQRIHADVSVEDDATLEVSTETLKPGHYTLSVEHLYDNQDAIAAGPVTVPFVIGALKGRVPDDLRVEHAVHLATNELSWSRLPPGQRPPSGDGYVEFVKAVHRETGQMVIKAFDESGEEIDGSAHLAEIASRRRAKFGCVDEALWKRLERLTENDIVDVVIVPNVGELAVELAGIEGDYMKPEEEHRVQQKVEERICAVASELRGLGLTLKQLPTSCTSFRRPWHLVRFGSEVRDLGNLIAISRADRVHALGLDGTGVNVAVYESGPRPNAADLPIRGRYLTDPPSISDEADEHGCLVCAIISNTEAGRPNGMAPGCNLFSANSDNTAALNWAVQQKWTVISQSFHRNEEQTSPSMSADDVLKGMFGQGVTIVQAAGNFGPWDTPPSTASEYVNRKGYNTIVVGNHNDAATAMVGSSVFRNPHSFDRELPLITANGEAVTAVGVTLTGTSCAAPAVAGTVALMQQSNGELRELPAACRAILLASADRNISGGTWWQDVQIPTDAADGAGALNAEAAVLIVQTRAIKDGPPRHHAWDGDRRGPGSFGPDNISKFRYRIQVPSATASGRFTVKVAFTWDSIIPANASGPADVSSLTRRYDLLVFDDRGVQVANSSSFDNNYEIAEFTGLPSQEYAIALRLTQGDESPSPPWGLELPG